MEQLFLLILNIFSKRNELMLCLGPLFECTDLFYSKLSK